MGLFSTTLHIYKKDQSAVVENLKEALRVKHLSTFERISIASDSFHNTLESDVYAHSGVYYLITEKYNQWTTIVELNVNIPSPFYLYELANEMSARLNTYVLSFHLHDDDVLYYNLEFRGEPLDGYSSNLQYFENDPLPKDEIISQRHTPKKFSEMLPSNKSVDGLNIILNRGYWQAFDNNDLDKDGIPKGEKYDVSEEDRLKDLGQYLEIFSADSFPYASWYEDIVELDLSKCFLLKADK